eukprot:TRINITY_DN49183_c0_g1_i1.p1 TRINITY_DN49183_c0_g1~~TRINITY_DN49183_c0_g1_i1.p1  ORF type:complete len:187 (-),score=25.56 TRINITY_DN49183_c0_g1_i1:198-758(-)
MSGEVVLCIRHIPCKILDADFQQAMHEAGLDAARYSLYLPKRKGRRGQFNNFGYGFATCNQRGDAEAFLGVFQGYQFENIQSSKRLLIELASVSLQALSHSNRRLTFEMNMLFDADAGAADDAAGNFSHADEGLPTASASSRKRVPHECEVPWTCLVLDEANRFRSMMHSQDFWHDSFSPMPFCFQ